MIRNLFDQYHQPENRLTHALATCLHESPALLKRFCAFLEHPVPDVRSATISEQYRPGRQASSESEAEALALPDIWIDDGREWCLVIESKIQHLISSKQLSTHARLAQVFRNAKVVLLSIREPAPAIRRQFGWRPWTAVYNWSVAEAVARPNDLWADRLARYMEALERTLIEEGKLVDGALTTFSGIHFDASNPYAYTEAKRLLRLLMNSVRASPRLLDQLGVNIHHKGRPAIKGRKGFAVWDVLPLAASGKAFNSAPHLTVAIRHNEAIAQLTIPDKVPPTVRRTLIGSDLEQFTHSLDRFLRDLKKLLTKDVGCKPYVEVIQRHWPRGQSAPSVTDAELTFDPRTVFGSGRIKEQPQWVRAALEVMDRKQSNAQISIGVRFPFAESTTVKTPQLADAIADVFGATATFLTRNDGGRVRRASHVARTR